MSQERFGLSELPAALQRLDHTPPDAIMPVLPVLSRGRHPSLASRPGPSSVARERAMG
jgi:hypothetical protein